MADLKSEFFFPFNKLQGLLKRLEKIEKKELVLAMQRVADVYEAEMVLLAPVDSGYLEGSTVVKVMRRPTLIAAQVKFAANYAADVHELPPSRRGPKTRAKPATKFGNPGPKYVERVLKGMDLAFFLGREVEAILARKG